MRQMNIPSRQAFFDDSQGSLLDQILDLLIPSGQDGRIPAAGQLGVRAFIEEQIGLSQDMRAIFDQGMVAIAALAPSLMSPDSLESLVSKLEQNHPEFFQTLLRLTYMGYYSRPDIRVLFGLSEKPTHPDGYQVPADDPKIMAELLAPVRSRPSCYRPTR